MSTPPPLRGKYYNTPTVYLCSQFQECIICSKCFHYSHSRQQCAVCESVLVPMDEGLQPQHICDHRYKPDLLLKAKALVQRFRAPLYHPDRLPRSAVHFPEQSYQQREINERMKRAWEVVGKDLQDQVTEQ